MFFIGLFVDKKCRDLYEIPRLVWNQFGSCKGFRAEEGRLWNHFAVHFDCVEIKNYYKNTAKNTVCILSL